MTTSEILKVSDTIRSMNIEELKQLLVSLEGVFANSAKVGILQTALTTLPPWRAAQIESAFTVAYPPAIVKCPKCGNYTEVVAEAFDFGGGDTPVVQIGQELELDYTASNFNVAYSYSCSDCGHLLAETIEDLQALWKTQTQPAKSTSEELGILGK